MGFVIDSNLDVKFGVGSCIFGYLWVLFIIGIVGCMVMMFELMCSLFGWLKLEDYLVFVLLLK